MKLACTVLLTLAILGSGPPSARLPWQGSGVQLVNGTPQEIVYYTGRSAQRVKLPPGEESERWDRFPGTLVIDRGIPYADPISFSAMSEGYPEIPQGMFVLVGYTLFVVPDSIWDDSLIEDHERLAAVSMPNPGAPHPRYCRMFRGNQVQSA